MACLGIAPPLAIKHGFRKSVMVRLPRIQQIVLAQTVTSVACTTELRRPRQCRNRRR